MRRLLHAVLVALVATPTLADCKVEALAFNQMDFSSVPPAKIDLSLRPVIPLCLSGLSDPKLETCSRDELAAFGAAVEAWSDALHEYVNDTNRFANELVLAKIFAVRSPSGNLHRFRLNSSGSR